MCIRFFIKFEKPNFEPNFGPFGKKKPEGDFFID